MTENKGRWFQNVILIITKFGEKPKKGLLKRVIAYSIVFLIPQLHQAVIFTMFCSLIKFTSNFVQ